MAKKLAVQIKQLEAEVDVLRSNGRVTELEKKLQVPLLHIAQAHVHTPTFAHRHVHMIKFSS